MASKVNACSSSCMEKRSGSSTCERFPNKEIDAEINGEQSERACSPDREEELPTEKHVTIRDVHQEEDLENDSTFCLHTCAVTMRSFLIGSCWEKTTKDEDPVPRIPFTSMTAERFFDRFVSQRRPCILTTSPKDFETHPGLKDFLPAMKKWKKNSYLKKMAGTVPVTVECSSTDHVVQRFGHGRRTTMPFGEFLDHIRSGREDLYLTTQRSTALQPKRPNGYSSVAMDLGNPLLTLTSLAQDFPSSPSLLKSLLPFEYNLWFGHSHEKISTGLHHDFHDNLYFLLRGQKTFRLFSPSCAEILNVQGKIVHVHENGLITYQPQIRSDGFPALHVGKWKLVQTKHQIDGLQERLKNVQEALKVLRNCVHTLDMTSCRKTDEGRKTLVSLGKLRRALKPSSNHPTKTGHSNFLNSKLSQFVTQGFLKKLCKVKPKHAKTLLQQEIRSRKESMDLLRFYIDEATERLLDLRLQYKALKRQLRHPNTSAVVEPSSTFSPLSSLAMSSTGSLCPDSGFSSCGSKKKKKITSSSDPFDKIEASFSKKKIERLLQKKRKALAQAASSVPPSDTDETSSLPLKRGSTTMSLEEDSFQDTASWMIDEPPQDFDEFEKLEDNKSGTDDHHLTEDDVQNNNEEEEEDDDDDTETSMDEDDFFTACFIDTLNQEEKVEEQGLTQDGSEQEETIPCHFCQHNTIDRTDTEKPLVWGKFPHVKHHDTSVKRQRYSELSDESFTMLQHYIEVHLSPGEFLYLPAGWFHEVFSLSTAPSNGKKKVKGVKNVQRSHLALNYWFYPPHVCGSAMNGEDGSGTFENPYQDGFCSRRYQHLELLRSQLPYVG